MKIINGYLAVKERTSKTSGKTGYRSFWIGRPIIGFKSVCLPKEYWGKKIRFKVEVDEK